MTRQSHTYTKKKNHTYTYNCCVIFLFFWTVLSLYLRICRVLWTEFFDSRMQHYFFVRCIDDWKYVKENLSSQFVMQLSRLSLPLSIFMCFFTIDRRFWVFVCRISCECLLLEDFLRFLSLFIQFTKWNF